MQFQIEQKYLAIPETYKSELKNRKIIFNTVSISWKIPQKDIYDCFWLPFGPMPDMVIEVKFQNMHSKQQWYLVYVTRTFLTLTYNCVQHSV